MVFNIKNIKGIPVKNTDINLQFTYEIYILRLKVISLTNKIQTGPIILKFSLEISYIQINAIITNPI